MAAARRRGNGMSTINDGGPALACARCAEPSVIKQGRQWLCLGKCALLPKEEEKPFQATSSFTLCVEQT